MSDKEDRKRPPGRLKRTEDDGSVEYDESGDPSKAGNSLMTDTNPRTLEDLNALAQKLKREDLTDDEMQRQMGMIYSRRKRLRQKSRVEELEQTCSRLQQENQMLRTEAERLTEVLNSVLWRLSQTDGRQPVGSIAGLSEARVAGPTAAQLNYQGLDRQVALYVMEQMGSSTNFPNAPQASGLLSRTQAFGVQDVRHLRPEAGSAPEATPTHIDALLAQRLIRQISSLNSTGSDASVLLRSIPPQYAGTVSLSSSEGTPSLVSSSASTSAGTATSGGSSHPLNANDSATQQLVLAALMGGTTQNTVANANTSRSAGSLDPHVLAALMRLAQGSGRAAPPR